MIPRLYNQNALRMLDLAERELCDTNVLNRLKNVLVVNLSVHKNQL